MSLFLHQDYRQFLSEHIRKLPRNGRGEISRMAKALGIHQTLMSLVIAGERELSLDQGYDLCAYLGLTPLEQDYLMLLIQFSRAGNLRHKDYVQKKLAQIRTESQQLSKRIEHNKVLSNEQRSVIYSSWVYSAIRLFCSTYKDGRSLEEVQQRFRLTRPRAVDVLNFLERSGLVISENGLYKTGPQRTFLEHGSPHLLKHHSNWRLKALQKSDHLSEKELMFTSPMALSKADFDQLRERLADFIKQFLKTVEDSPSEEVACLNVDFFWVD